MKKIIYMFLFVTICLSDCTSINMSEVTTENSQSPIPSSAINSPIPVRTESPEPDNDINVTPFPTIPPYINVYTTAPDEVYEKPYVDIFEEHLGFIPTNISIDLLNMECYMQLETEWLIEDYENQFILGHTDPGGFFWYFGNLTKVSENIYFSKGQVIDYFKDKTKYVNENTDFYLIFQNEKLFITFENLTTEELKSYTSPNFLIKNTYD